MSAEPVAAVILGAGPAGLAAAWLLARRGFRVIVLERAAAAGGNAGSFELDGVPVDYGSHRLHPSCPPAILADLRRMLGPDLLDRPRHGRILLRGRWVRFPLKPLDLASHLPLSFALGVLRDAMVRRSSRAGASFAGVLERGLGRTICRDFYFPYARKIWGLPPEELDPEQARRRVRAASLGGMLRKVLSAVPGFKPPGGGRFYYPRRGYGRITEAYRQAAVESSATVLLNTGVSAVELDHNRAAAVESSGRQGPLRFPSRLVLSTIPVTALARASKPPAPAPVLAAADSLKFRSMILVYLVLEADRFTEYDAHYFPGSGIAITRLSEPKNYGLAGAPGVTVLCAELPCSAADPVWQHSDDTLGSLVLDALSRAGLPVRVPVRRTVTRRLEQAYPIYTLDYQQHFDLLDCWLNGIDGLASFGRQGLFAHDNTHHALAMAYAACECIDDAGKFDKTRWNAHRLRFREHVVED
jgi:protoporphyrinogen oxidase